MTETNCCSNLKEGESQCNDCFDGEYCNGTNPSCHQTSGTETNPTTMSEKQKKEICQLCKKEIKTTDYGDGVVDYGSMMEYRGFVFHEECFDEGTERVDAKRKEVMEVTEHSIKSQADGEWANGGYKTMKTDMGGNPIPSKVNEPLILKDYEAGIL